MNLLTDNFEIKIPASTANIGPAFDSMGLALNLYLSVRGKKSQSNSWKITVNGEYSEKIPTAPEENLICKTVKLIAKSFNIEIPALELEIFNKIPITAGLGSSAAAITAGIGIVEIFLGKELSEQEFFREARKLESHADNLAAARFGGCVTILNDNKNESAMILRHTWPNKIKLIVVHPHFELSTKVMRSVIPEYLSRADVVFQIQHVLTLLTAIKEERFELIHEAMQDKLHQPFRAEHIPGLKEILNLSCPGLLATALSGAGPSVLALATTNLEEIANSIQKCFDKHGHTSTVYFTNVNLAGRLITTR